MLKIINLLLALFKLSCCAKTEKDDGMFGIIDKAIYLNAESLDIDSY